MKFSHPAQFEIPDEWWQAAGMSGFKAKGVAYASMPLPESVMAIVALKDVQPPRRNPGFRYFNEQKMMKILLGFVRGEAIPPVEVHELPAPNPYRYGVRNGFHRYYASVAAGYDHLPVEVVPYFVAES